MQTYLTNHVTHSFAIFAEHVARSTSLLKPQSDLGAFSFGVGECVEAVWTQLKIYGVVMFKHTRR